MHGLGGAPEGLTREQAAHFTLPPLAEIRARELEELAYAILFMLPGIPCIYYGDEDYMQGCSDSFNRAPQAMEHGRLSEADSRNVPYQAHFWGRAAGLRCRQRNAYSGQRAG